MLFRPQNQSDMFGRLEAHLTALEDEIERHRSEVAAKVVVAVAQLNDALTEAREKGAVFRVAPMISEFTSFTEGLTAVYLRERIGLRLARVDDTEFWQVWE